LRSTSVGIHVLLVRRRQQVICYLPLPQRSFFAYRAFSPNTSAQYKNQPKSCLIWQPCWPPLPLSLSAPWKAYPPPPFPCFFLLLYSVGISPLLSVLFSMSKERTRAHKAQHAARVQKYTSLGTCLSCVNCVLVRQADKCVQLPWMQRMQR
jgi:hypothetical protein